jgi:hypothetical protein
MCGTTTRTKRIPIKISELEFKVFHKSKKLFNTDGDLRLYGEYIFLIKAKNQSYS